MPLCTRAREQSSTANWTIAPWAGYGIKCSGVPPPRLDRKCLGGNNTGVETIWEETIWEWEQFGRGNNSLAPFRKRAEANFLPGIIIWVGVLVEWVLFCSILWQHESVEFRSAVPPEYPKASWYNTQPQLLTSYLRGEVAKWIRGSVTKNSPYYSVT